MKQAIRIKLVSHQTIHHRHERLKNIKIGKKIDEIINEKIGEKIGHYIQYKLIDLGVTQPDYQIQNRTIFNGFKYIKPIEYNDETLLNE